MDEINPPESKIGNKQILMVLKNYQETAPKLLQDKNYAELMSYSINGSFVFEEYIRNNYEMLKDHSTATFFTYAISASAGFKAMSDLFMKGEYSKERQIMNFHKHIMKKMPAVILGLEALVDVEEKD
tara:strand:- start:653 stop:1033 length:381 start_codon:yes stop_codon:yes gene_type:complete